MKISGLVRSTVTAASASTKPAAKPEPKGEAADGVKTLTSAKSSPAKPAPAKPAPSSSPAVAKQPTGQVSSKPGASASTKPDDAPPPTVVGGESAPTKAEGTQTAGRRRNVDGESDASMTMFDGAPTLTNASSAAETASFSSPLGPDNGPASGGRTRTRDGDLPVDINDGDGSAGTGPTSTFLAPPGFVEQHGGSGASGASTQEIASIVDSMKGVVSSLFTGGDSDVAAGQDADEQPDAVSLEDGVHASGSATAEPDPESSNAFQIIGHALFG